MDMVTMRLPSGEVAPADPLMATENTQSGAAVNSAAIIRELSHQLKIGGPFFVVVLFAIGGLLQPPQAFATSRAPLQIEEITVAAERRAASARLLGGNNLDFLPNDGG